MSCHDVPAKAAIPKGKKVIKIALAGNANVGKSVIFNYFTGGSQIIGNWPGKTVEKTEGYLRFKNHDIYMIDLPGIYSLGTYSEEELISAEYILNEKPDIVINVVDATRLERNLYFTQQLLDLYIPVIIALNCVDELDKKGMSIDVKKLENLLGIPVIPTIATKGYNLYKLLEQALAIIQSLKFKVQGSMVIRFSNEIEQKLSKLMGIIDKTNTSKTLNRYLAIRLIENPEHGQNLGVNSEQLITAAKILKNYLEERYRKPCSAIFAQERYLYIQKITEVVLHIKKITKKSLTERFDNILLHRVYGPICLVLFFIGTFFLIFYIGDLIATSIDRLITSSGLEGFIINNVKDRFIQQVIWDGFFGGLFAGIGIVLPYMVPFYLMLGVLEANGYLARIAFLLDNIMHKIGLHGKAIIPLLLGYGCSVPAIVGTKILETKRDRYISSFLATMVPCSARTVVILAVVATFVGVFWAFGLYVIDIVLIFVIGALLNRYMKGESTGLIMEMPPLRKPNMRTVFRQAWLRIKSFLKVVMPVYIVGSIIFIALLAAGLLDYINPILAPVTVFWLGLPAITGVLLVMGILRKELSVVLLAVLLGTFEFSTVMSNVQMLVFTFVIMVYVPCIATIITLWKEFTLKFAIFVTIFEIGLAIFLGGILYRVLEFGGVSV